MSNYDFYILIFTSLVGFILNKLVKDEDVLIAINTMILCFIFGYLTCLGLNFIFK
jgi:hypothetical protein